MSKKTKGIISGAIIVVVLVIGTILYFQQENALKNKKRAQGYSAVKVTEGTISSSTLLSGTVKALSEEYVYFNPAKGTSASVSVKVGDKVTAGQPLVQYSATAAQAAYDTAARNLNKVGRQINYLKTYGVPMAGGEGAGAQASSQQTAGYNQQLQDLNDAYADAQAEVNKAQQALNETVVSSSVSGTVVEVNQDIDPSSKESQPLVHVTSEGQLQVKGSLTEYDLGNIKTGQAVKIKSKVYTDQEWTGKIAYISNYPKDEGKGQSQGMPNGAPASSSTASYDYKVDITSPLRDLKQGFSVSVEVVNEVKHALVPVEAVFKKDKKNYVWVYDSSSSKVKQVEVKLGNADAKKQEIISGLEVGQVVISNPDKSIKNDEKVENVHSEDRQKKSSKSEVKK